MPFTEFPVARGDRIRAAPFAELRAAAIERGVDAGGAINVGARINGSLRDTMANSQGLGGVGVVSLANWIDHVLWADGNISGYTERIFPGGFAWDAALCFTFERAINAGGFDPLIYPIGTSMRGKRISATLTNEMWAGLKTLLWRAIPITADPVGSEWVLSYSPGSAIRSPHQVLGFMAQSLNGGATWSVWTNVGGAVCPFGVATEIGRHADVPGAIYQWCATYKETWSYV